MKINVTKYDDKDWVALSDYESLFWRFEAAMAWLEEMKEYLPEGVIEGLKLENAARKAIMILS